MKNKKTKLCAVLLLGLGLSTVQSQEAFPASGGNASSSSGSVSYSVGLMVFKTISGSDGSVTQGVQQPFEIATTLELEEFQGNKLNLYAYPNPTIESITLKADIADTNDLSYQFFDITGRLLMNRKLQDNETNIQVSNIAPATYFLKILQNNKEVKIFKIIKN
ncbi:Por secretion system C-terminal sorting domain-containing protein [Flavobacteriaceae bacterium MAR_2010_188]|nr:Por secretion system C-terminal sorting domain-containing protein [Flavobacteriaceae bacterium MAR_2010_188]